MKNDEQPDEAVSWEIDWATAEVHDAELEVSLTGAPSKEWKTGLEAVVTRLDHSGHPWGGVRPTKRGLKVADVAEGHEAELRHFLEAAVQQANADLATNRPDPPVGGVSDFDRRMTDAFRRDRESPAES